MMVHLASPIGPVLGGYCLLGGMHRGVGVGVGVGGRISSRNWMIRIERTMWLSRVRQGTLVLIPALGLQLEEQEGHGVARAIHGQVAPSMPRSDDLLPLRPKKEQREIACRWVQPLCSG